MKKVLFSLFCQIIVLFFLSQTAFAQPTEFTYQGQLQTSGASANGNYDFEFALFEAVSAGTQLGSTIAVNNVAVSNGSFSVRLNFGDQFPGTDRFLEVRVRQAGGGALTTLAPRQKITSAPYGVKALNAQNAVNAENAVNATNAANATTANNSLNLGGVAANQYVLTGDARLSDARNPLPNSSDYIQNTTSQQSSNFNISGNGTIGGTLSGNVVNAVTQYNLNGQRILRATGNSLIAGIVAGSQTTGGGSSFFGYSAGRSNTTGFGNSFFGSEAGDSNTTGSNNSFFGFLSGSDNSTGDNNSFFGFYSGQKNTTGIENSFFGNKSGSANTTGKNNSFFGNKSGELNTTGLNNSFFGYQSGFSNTTGADNSFFGYVSGASNTTGGNNSFFGKAGSANTTGSYNSFFGDNSGGDNTTGELNSFFGMFSGSANTTGKNNTMLGSFANVGSGNLINTTAVGFRALVAQNNSLVLGGINGINGATADTNVGIGTTAPLARFHLSGAGILRARINSNINAGVLLTLGEQPKWSVATVNEGQFQIFNETNGQNAFWINAANNFVGIGTTAPTERLHVAGNGLIGSNLIVNNSIGIGTSNPADKLDVNGGIRIATLGIGGATALCRNAFNQISTCSSSMRYKSNVENFRSGLELIKRLRPVFFNWTEGGMLDLGLVAEEVNKVEPLLTNINEKGETEGVKYDRIGVILVNAVNEQQLLIEAQQRKIESQQLEFEILKLKLSELDALKQLVCQQNKTAANCQSDNQ